MGQSDSSLTPEQRLLKLIEEPESGAAGGPQSTEFLRKSGKTAFAPQKILDPAVLKGLVTGAVEKIQGWSRGEGGFNLRMLIWPVRILAVILFFILLASLAVEYMAIDRRLNSFSKIEQQERAETPGEPIKTVSGLEEEDRRNVFVPVTKEEGPTKEGGQASVALIEMTKDLKLTGISADPDNPDRTFCMIEDLKKNLTSFLKKGDTISGMKVESITSDEVVLTYNQEKIELR